MEINNEKKEEISNLLVRKNNQVSKTLQITILIVAGLIVILFIFSIGMSVGFKKATFSYRWGENYHRNFAGPRGGFFNDFIGRDFIDAHGLIGKIIKINDSSIIIKDKDGIEKIILIDKKTDIRKFRESIKFNDLKIDDLIIIIGQPNQNGEVEAKFIRIMPPPPVSGNFLPNMHPRENFKF